MPCVDSTDGRKVFISGALVDEDDTLLARGARSDGAAAARPAVAEATLISPAHAYEV
jgi:hypothetical protein